MDTDINTQKKHILLIYPRLIPSIRLCGYVQLEELLRQNLIEFKAVPIMQVHSADLDWADIAIFGRSDSWYESALARQLRNAGKQIAYIIDDDMLNIPPHLASAAYLNRKDIRRNIENILSLSDIIISHSPILLSKYVPKSSGCKGILVEEPAIFPMDYIPHDPSQPVQIGFAGSIDRTQDIEFLLKEALLKIKAEYGEKVAFSFYGAIPAFAKELNAVTIPYTDSYESYRETLNASQWDIGLAPMPETPFHACKHYNKFVEYAASGIVGIYSDTEPYLRLKDWEHAGLFCSNTPEDWYNSIRYLLEHRELLENMRKQVCEYCKGRLSVRSSTEDFYQQLAASFVNNQTCRHSLFLVMPCKIIHYCVRGFWFVVSHRKDLLSAVLAKIKHTRSIT